jgi:hypothetical protein
MEPLEFLVVEIVAPFCEDLGERHEFDDLNLRSIGGLLEHAATARQSLQSAE